MNNYEDPTPNGWNRTIMERTNCSAHGVGFNQPCWEFMSRFGGHVYATCDKRARMAGFAGRISPSSLRVKSQRRQKQNDER